eukprot:GFUD01026716.1.p1 GENE.GFUD01026716.1~~GFUD01026716.1.p1  ORF type:complete len:453 (-),score=122.68 GFUD01026716.1:117-1475(-)
MEVSLSMYPIPGLESATLLWTTGLSKLGSHLPSGIHLSQTCGLPLITHQAGQFRVVAIPQYGVRGCEGHRYSSVVVVNSKSPVSSVSDLKHSKVAVNSIDSLSGHLLLGLTMGRTIYSSTIPIYTGGHLASLHKVTTGEVTAAAIDCVTYALAERHVPHLTAHTKVVAISPSYPALPYVVSKDITEEQFIEVQEVLKKALEDPSLTEARKTLCIEGFEFSDGVVNQNIYEDEIKAGFAKLAITYEEDLDDIASNSNITAIEDISEEDKDYLLGAVNLATEVLKKSGEIKAQSDSVFADGRKIRIIITGIKNCLKQQNRCKTDIVGFFGTRLRLHETKFENLKIISKCWQADDMIVSNFDPLVVEAYITCEKNPGGDWFNLVILSEGARVEEFTSNNLVHSKVVKEVAPFYYSHVRIHRGVLDLDGGGLTFNRTLALHYREGTVVRRDVKIWN